MRQRPGVSLTEVLVAIFIMGIGIMSILALFPLGVQNMAQAVKDERCAQAAGNAFALSKILGSDGVGRVGIWKDTQVVAAYDDGPALPVGGPSYPVFVDPAGASFGQLGVRSSVNSPGIPRVVLSTVPYSPLNMVKWFTLQDDLTLNDSGVANPVERQGHYTWAYMCRRVNATLNPADLYIVVYYRRYPAAEPTYDATFILGSRSASLRRDPATDPDFEIRKGTWILDATIVEAGVGKPHGYFYRVESVQPNPSDPNIMQLELNVPARAGAAFGVGVGVVMRDVVEVFEKGPQP